MEPAFDYQTIARQDDEGFEELRSEAELFSIQPD
jgi:hypothetical protein